MDVRWPLYGALVLMLVACGGGSGGGSAPLPPVEARTTFQDGGALGAQRNLIENLIDDTFDRAGRELPIDQVKVTITTDPARTIPGWGMGGYALGPADIELVIDPLFADLDARLTERLPHIVAHELHHTVRLRDPGFYLTLREALVFEAMADHFAAAVVDGELPPWTRAFPDRDTGLYLARAEPELDRPFDFAAWFFGQGTDLPQWTGYTLGYRLLLDYFVANPDDSAASLVNAPAEQILPVDAT